MSHCYIIGRLPVASVTNARTNRYAIDTVLSTDNAEYTASLFAYMLSPPLHESLFEVEAAFANNGGPLISLSPDFREIELLGLVSPSEEDHLATCPDIRPPRFNVLGVASSPNTTTDFHTFNVAGTSYIVDTNQPFTVKVCVDRSNQRWASFFMPAVGQTVGIGDRLIGREQEATGLLIIELNHITYGPTRRAAPESPAKPGMSPSKGGGCGYGNKQRELKRKRDNDKEDEDEVAAQLQRS
ncbi:hypothetical protein B0H13DRAFT_1882926 [Mycena leptocephala]|nr:hypothetical protein B0H13DRAFT_1882926 [Mycena leptocephala]